MFVKPEEHHHTCRKSEDHHCKCCSCECQDYDDLLDESHGKWEPRGRKYYQYTFRIGDKVVANIEGNWKAGVIISSKPKNRQEEVKVRITGYERKSKIVTRTGVAWSGSEGGRPSLII